MDRDFILQEIKRTAIANGGKAPGTARFEKETGIRIADWEGKYWSRWGDALQEAGFAPNTLQSAFSDDVVMEALARIVRDLGHLPARNELKMRHFADPSVPSYNVFGRIGPTKQALVARLLAFCDQHPEYDDVASICQAYEAPEVSRKVDGGSRPQVLGDVYLIKSGRYYKIGYSVSAERRTREFQIQLPDMPQRIHTIRTDDPRGVEAYWHKRFEAKRVRPDAEFFRLDASDVRAFCAWKRIV